MMVDYHTHYWATAIKINRLALTRVLAEIFALLGIAAGGTVDRLSQDLYTAVERLLRPAESAVRRLIVIAARGLAVKPLPKHVMPAGLKVRTKATGPMAFRLFDTRKKFDFIEAENSLFVTVKTYTSNPFNPFDKMYLPRLEKPGGSINAVQLCRRIAAVKRALETLPRQAQRLARWQARRNMMQNPKFTSPLRPGPPPGFREKPALEVDLILQECHGLAWDSQREDSS